MYKMILSDLDETLLVNHHVPKFNQEAISKARSKGVKFVPCTGRAYNMISEILKEIGTYDQENEYSLCFNGGLIVENKDHKVLHFKGLSYDLASSLFDIGQTYNVCMLVFTLDCCYIFNADQDEIDRKIAQKATFEVIDKADMSFLKDQNIAKILFEKRDMDYLKNIKEQLINEYDEKVEMTFSSNRYLEFNAKGIDKGYGLHWLANYLNIPIEEVISIGDNYNDVEMLKEAGLGCCVSSASSDIQDLCDYVCKHDYGDGAVKEVIEKFIMEEA